MAGSKRTVTDADSFAVARARALREAANADDTIGVMEAAARARCSLETIRLAIARGDLQAKPNGDYSLIRVGDLDAWARARGLLLRA